MGGRSHEHLWLERDGAVARLLIDRPTKRNALDQSMWQHLPTLIADAMADKRVGLLVIGSAQPGLFCAGADIAEFATSARDPAWRAANQAAIRATQLALTRASKPTIAAVDGDCVGGGCGLAIACDLRVASPHARFGLTPAKLGIAYPVHDTKLLVDLVGPAQAKRMIYTAALLDAQEAARIGLVQIVTPPDGLQTAVDELAESILANSPHTQHMAKLFIRRILDGMSDDDADAFAAFGAAFDGPDFHEGVDAFLVKRRPNFRRI